MYSRHDKLIFVLSDSMLSMVSGVVSSCVRSCVVSCVVSCRFDDDEAKFPVAIVGEG